MTTLLIGGSVVLASIAVVSQFVLSQKYRAGWLLSILFSTLALPYDLITHQYGFMATSVLGIFIAANGWRKWGRS